MNNFNNKNVLPKKPSNSKTSIPSSSGNNNETSDLNQAQLLATAAAMFPGLFNNNNVASNSSNQYQQYLAAANILNQPVPVKQSSLVKSSSNSALNTSSNLDAYIVSLKTNLFKQQEQQQQQQHQIMIEQNAKNNIWSKMLNDISLAALANPNQQALFTDQNSNSHGGSNNNTKSNSNHSAKEHKSSNSSKMSSHSKQQSKQPYNSFNDQMNRNQQQPQQNSHFINEKSNSIPQKTKEQKPHQNVNNKPPDHQHRQNQGHQSSNSTNNLINNNNKTHSSNNTPSHSKTHSYNSNNIQKNSNTQRSQNSAFSIDDLIKPSNNNNNTPQKSPVNTKKSTIVKPVPVNIQHPPSAINSPLNNYLNSFLQQQQPQQTLESHQNGINSLFSNQNQNLMNFNHNDAFSQYASLLQSINPMLLANISGAGNVGQNATNSSSSMDIFSQLSNMLLAPSHLTNQQQPAPYSHVNLNNNSSQLKSVKRESSPPQQPTKSSYQDQQQKTKIKQEPNGNATFIDTNENNNMVEIVEAKIKLPLKHGWKRETIVKEIHKNGIRGDVIYYSPCSKKLRTFQEIERYLNKNSTELKSKNVELTRDNFTFSSKLIVGTFLLLKEPYASLVTNLNSNNAHQLLNYDANLVTLIDENIDDKVKKELKFHILNEADLIAKISELNPSFKRKTSAFSSMDDQSKIKVNGLKIKAESQIDEFEKHQLNLQLQTQINSQQNQQANFLLKNNQKQQQIQQQHNMRVQQHQEKQQLQQKVKFEMIEAKRMEKYLQRERKTKEKWFEYIMSREQQQSSSQQLRDEAQLSASTQQLPFDPIDDMQEKYLKEMPCFKQLQTDNDSGLEWIGDTLQVIEFMQTFGNKLKESLAASTTTAEVISNGGDLAHSDSSNSSDSNSDCLVILENIESFRQGLQNKSAKLRKEVLNLVQLLLKSVINNNIKAATLVEQEDNDDGEEEVEGETPPLNDADSDELSMIKRLSLFECNDLTFSELLRLYFLQCLNNLRLRRVKQENQNLYFGIDVTSPFYEKLKVFTELLEDKSFELLEAGQKASMMAYLCDELLTTTNYDLQEEDVQNSAVNTVNSVNNGNSVVNGCHNTNSIEYSNQDGIIVKDLEQAIEELNQAKHEKWQLDSKTRSLKTEKLTATLNLKKQSKKHPESPANDQTAPLDPEKDKTEKNLQSIEKKLVQIDKKRQALKRTFEKCLQRLRSGQHLGQDRFMRHYWSLINSGGIFIESCSKSAGPGSYYFTDDPNPSNSDQIVSNLMEDLLQNLESDEVLEKYSCLIERSSNDDPFKFSLKTNMPLVETLTFREIEILVKNEIQLKQPQVIDETKYFNTGGWWLCENANMLKDLTESLCKRGFREKNLSKSLHKLCEENFQSIVAINGSDDQESTFYQNRYLNNAGNLQMFEKQKKLFTDLVTNPQCHAQLEQKEQSKILKQIHSLEDRVFKSNLQKVNHQKNENTHSAKQRLLDLEQSIERRYLKYPFAPLRKFSNIKLDKDLAENVKKSSSQTLVDLIEKNSKKIQQNMDYVPRELERWRRMVTRAKTSSQIALLLSELYKVIAWNKSIMKVICQICNCDTNEDKLLLCDNCDCGSHTYCFKPVIKTIPEGDWYCFMCIGKLLSESSMCCVCGSSENISPILDTDNARINKSLMSSSPIINDLYKCDKCDKRYHGTCMPNAKHFKTTQKSHCLNCQNKSKASLKFNTNHIHQQQQSHKQIDDENDNSNSTSASSSNVVKSNKKSFIITDDLSAKHQKKRKTNKNAELDEEPGTEDPDEDPTVDEEETAEPGENEAEDYADDDHEEETNESSTHEPTSLNNSLKNKKKKRKRSRLTLVKSKAKFLKSTNDSSSSVTNEKDISQCRNLLTELIRNDNAWPFTDKVSPDDYPNYYEVIKEPMDFQTIKSKCTKTLTSTTKPYETKEQFAYDCRLIFDNCEFFNEDKSDIGRAGHKLRAFFETKWIKLFD